MEIFLSTLFVAVFGVIVGSFLNVVILRFNTGKTVSGRSGCFSCGRTLAWYELIPVFSYLFLRGRCRTCHSHISIQYPIVELLNGILYAWLFSTCIIPSLSTGVTILEGGTFLTSCVLWSSLLVIVVYDIRHTIIPDLFSGIFFVCASVITIFSAYHIHEISVIYHHMLAAVVFGSAFFLLWFISRGAWMGFGDVKLVVSIGLYLGITQGASALAFAFWIGAAFALLRITWEKILTLGTKQLSSRVKTLTMKSEVPFAPFLILGTFLALFLGSDIFHLSFLFHA